MSLFTWSTAIGSSRDRRRTRPPRSPSCRGEATPLRSAPIGSRNKNRSCKLWDFCNGLNIFKLRQSAALIFCSDVTRLQQNGGVFMHHTTLIVLMVLTLGQIFMLTFGVLILWLAGEFGDAPKLFKGSHSTD